MFFSPSRINMLLKLFIIHFSFIKGVISKGWQGEHIQTTSSGLPREFEKEIENYFKNNGKWSKNLTEFLTISTSLPAKPIYKQIKYDDEWEGLSRSLSASAEGRAINRHSVGEGGFITCALCRAAFFALTIYNKMNGSTTLLTIFVVKFCKFTRFDLEFCKGVVELNMPILLYIMKKNPSLTANTICGFIAQESCANTYKPKEWTIYAYDDIPKIYTKRTSRGRKPLQIAHLTDAHYDPLYQEGSLADCKTKSVCCREKVFFPSPKTSAGYWGDYRYCDSPDYAVINIMEQVRDNHPNLAAVYYTGDVVAHNVWDVTYDQLVNSAKFVFKNLERIFRHTCVFPIIGNHEAQPLNQFSPSNITDPRLSSKWLFELVAGFWTAWLPRKALKTVKKGAFYSIKSRPGFRIIGLNSNVCYTFNWWLLVTSVDLYGQLQWLADELRKAELAGEHVHILSHVPPGLSDCEQVWAREYRKIVTRFSHIIKGQFNGHTHRDEMRIFYDPIDKFKAINVAWNGGSMVPYNDVNSNYRIYYIDPDTFEVIDYDQWIYNLTEANIYGHRQKPRWYKLYSFKDAYQVDSLQPEDLHKLVVRMKHDDSLIRQYFMFKGKYGDAFLSQQCGETCLKNELCNIVQTEFNDTLQCKLIELL